MNNSIAIDQVSIRQDDAGRYSLNDLHIAAGGEERHKPSNFLRQDYVRDLCAEIDRCSDLSIASLSLFVVELIKGHTHAAN